MKFRILTATEKDRFDADVMAVLDFNDVVAQGATTTGAAINVLPATTNGAVPAVGTNGTDNVPVGTRIVLKGMRVTTEFVSASAAGLTIKVGDGNSTSRFLAATQIQNGQTPVDYTVGIGTGALIYTTADTVDALFVSTTANLSTFTAGELVLYFSVEDYNQLPTR